jgi:hypothetical protein
MSVAARAEETYHDELSLREFVLKQLHKRNAYSFSEVKSLLAPERLRGPLDLLFKPRLQHRRNEPSAYPIVPDLDVSSTRDIMHQLLMQLCLNGFMVYSRWQSERELEAGLRPQDIPSYFAGRKMIGSSVAESRPESSI